MQFGMMDHMMGYFGTGFMGTLSLIVIIFGLLLLYLNYLILVELKSIRETMEKVKELLTSIQ
jgi:hypothetical protein